VLPCYKVLHGLEQQLDSPWDQWSWLNGHRLASR